MDKRDDAQIKREFWRRQGRQCLAIAAALFLVLLMAVVHKRSDLFIGFSRESLVAAQVVIIAVFMGFTALNWRCPSCRKYLGNNIASRLCRHCRVRLR
jgi:hypothetical protein